MSTIDGKATPVPNAPPPSADADPPEGASAIASTAGAAAEMARDDIGAGRPTTRKTPRPPLQWTILRPSGSKRPGTSAAATRRLLWASTQREVRTRYKQNAGRGAWMVIQPIAMVLIYGWVFTEIFGATGEGLPYLTMAWCGIILWQFFQHGVQMGMWSLIYEAGTLPKVWFPRVVVPLTPGSSAFVDLGVGLVLLLVVASVQGITFTITIIAAPLPIILLAIWMYAFALLLAPMAVFIRDLTTVVPLFLRLGFFASPVMYSIASIPEQYDWLGEVNPVAVAISGVRDTVLGGNWPQWKLLAAQTVAGLVVLGLAYVYFRRVEDRLVDAL